MTSLSTVSTTCTPLIVPIEKQSPRPVTFHASFEQAPEMGLIVQLPAMQSRTPFSDIGNEQ